MKILIPDLVSNSYFPAIAAVELGFFREEGLDMTLEHVYPVTKCLELMGDEACDFVVGTAHAVPQVFPEYRGAKLVAAVAQHMYWFLVVRSDLAVARGDLNGIKGLRIGAAPLVDQGLRSLLAAADIDIDKDDVQIGPVPGAAAAGVSFGVQAAKALEDGLLDGFWANGIGAEIAVRNGVGNLVLDVRRGEGPSVARDFTFAAFIAPDRLIEGDPATVAAAVRAMVKVQRALVAHPERATQVAQKWFPAQEASMIDQVLRRDLPYYDPVISETVVASVHQFLQDLGLMPGPVPYERAVATQFGRLWTE